MGRRARSTLVSLPIRHLRLQKHLHSLSLLNTLLAMSNTRDTTNCRRPNRFRLLLHHTPLFHHCLTRQRSTQSSPKCSNSSPASASRRESLEARLSPPIPPKVLLPHGSAPSKGARRLLRATRFFKIYEPCRNRYHNYGTMKRAR